jgi:outer membrane protein assembly factor BamB
LGRFFRINSPPVVAETLDGEATIVDLESGTYYALNESGTFVWDELSKGADGDSIPDALAARYGIDAEEARGAVDGIVGELL